MRIPWLLASVLAACAVTDGGLPASTGTSGSGPGDTPADDGDSDGTGTHDDPDDDPPPDPDDALPSIDESLVDWLAARPHAEPDSDVDVSLHAGEAVALGTVIRAALDGRWSEAIDAAQAIGFELGRVDGAVAIYTDDGIGPTVVIGTGTATTRDVIVQVPHSASEEGTAAEGAALFARLRARALMLEGAHRCASFEESSCDGTTEVCDGEPAPFRASDVAHARSSLFETAHETLASRFPSALVIQLHRMRSDPVRVVVSNGSGEEYEDDGSLPTRLAKRLRGALGPGRAASCQDAIDQELDYPNLCATTNVQGRWLDGSADACEERGGGGGERFLHLEQSPGLLDEDPPAGQVVDAIVAELGAGW